MNSLIAFLIILASALSLHSTATKLEAKLNPPEIKSQNVLDPNFTINTFPLLDKSVIFNFRPKSGLVIDQNNDYIIWQKNINEVRPIASISKMMTSLVVAKERSLDENITIPKQATEVEGSSGGFNAGEKVKIKDVIKAMLISSANDGADSLAIDLKTKGFDLVGEMNKEAQNLGLTHTHFEDTIGLSEKNVSTAWELYLLSKEFLKNDYLRSVVKEQTDQICSTGGTCHDLLTTNRLLADAGFSGIKTGYTGAAGNCFVGLKNIDNKYPTIFIVLDAADGHIRFDDPQVASQYLQWYGLY